MFCNSSITTYHTFRLEVLGQCIVVPHIGGGVGGVLFVHIYDYVGKKYYSSHMNTFKCTLDDGDDALHHRHGT
jgi:hypothetical protein